jgi:hypothetical protein
MLGFDRFGKTAQGTKYLVQTVPGPALDIESGSEVCHESRLELLHQNQDITQQGGGPVGYVPSGTAKFPSAAGSGCG